MELAYQLWKCTDPTDPTKKIALLHGMGGTGALWRPVAAALEEHFDVLAPDQRGHGKSQIPHSVGGRASPAYTPLEYGKDLIETMGNLQFHPAWLVGHSMGVRTAVAAAHLKPEWVKGLLLVDLGFTGVAGGGLGEGLASFLKKLPGDFASREEARAFMSANCPDPSIAQYLMAVSIKTPEGRLTFPFDHAALVATIHAARDASVKTWVHELGSRGMPIIVLRGARSLVWSHEEFETERRDFSDLRNVVFKEIAGAGHGLPFEQRQAFVSEILAMTGTPKLAP